MAVAMSSFTLVYLCVALCEQVARQVDAEDEEEDDDEEALLPQTDTTPVVVTKPNVITTKAQNTTLRKSTLDVLRVTTRRDTPSKMYTQNATSVFAQTTTTVFAQKSLVSMTSVGNKCTRPVCPVVKCSIDPTDQLAKQGDWKATCGYRFWLSKEKRSWAAAREFCLCNNLRLLSMEDASKMSCLSSIVPSLKLGTKTYWTSGTDEGCEGTFWWCAGDVATHSGLQWCKNKPDNSHGRENCVVWVENNSLINKERRSCFDDRNCIDQHLFVCEYSGGGNETIKETARQSKAQSHSACAQPLCPSIKCAADVKMFTSNGTRLVPGKQMFWLSTCNAKYLFAKNEMKLSWLKAQEFCCSLDMRLLSINSLQHHTCLAQLSQGGALMPYIYYYFWTAGTDQLCKNNFLWCPAAMNFGPNLVWRTGNPDNSNGNEGCVALEFYNSPNKKEVSMNDRPCKEQLPFICEHISTPAPLTQQDMRASTCVSHCAKCTVVSSKESKLPVAKSFGINKVGCRRQLVFSKKMKSQSEAAEACCAFNMSLISFESPSDLACLEDLYQLNFLDSGKFWTSGHKCRDKTLWCGTGGIARETSWDQTMTSQLDQCVVVTFSTESEEHEVDKPLTTSSCTQALRFICSN